MSLQAGIVGLPNVGKSTLFNALSAGKAEAANYPFATIDPNVGVVPVPDPRLDRLESVIETEKVVPTVVEIVDIAGLVRGASEGEGLGNQFLNHIRSVDAILHVLRCFDDPDVSHVEGSIDPLRDAGTVNLELVLADLAVCERRLDRLTRAAKTGDKSAASERDLVGRLVEALSDGVPARALELSPAEKSAMADTQLLTQKPVLYVCNTDESGLGGNAYTRAVEELAEKENAGCISICAEVEAEIVQLDPSERGQFLEELGSEEPGLALLTRETYRILGLETFFTVSPKEVRAWPVRHGTKAPQAAGIVHSDFERGFIRAEVCSIDDLVAYGSEAAVRAAGRMRAEGKDYVVRDGDVILFRFNV